VQRIGAFITPHGFGHATRAIGVLEALQRRLPDLAIEICTTVPEQLFHQSLHNMTFHHLIPDVGIVQKNALVNDLPATVRALDKLMPFSQELIDRLAHAMHRCCCILCDIAPLGILVAERAAIPSVLVENFTWDWIYQPYIAEYPELGRHAQALAEIYRRSTLHIQTEPVCHSLPDTVVCPPVFRQIHTPPEIIKKHVGAKDRSIVMVSLGGIDFHLSGWPAFTNYQDCFFVLAGQPEQRRLSVNCLALSRHTPLYHPDLIGAAELVVFKSGYSTLAECLQAGTRGLCIDRPSFGESRVLGQFLRQRLGGTVIEEDEFLTGAWLDRLPDLLAAPRPPYTTENGAENIADRMIHLCHQ